jgi:PKD repeat protein
MLRKCCFIVILASATLISAEDYSQWLYSRNITLNTRASGANVVSTLKKFPVLVRLSPADSLVFKNAKAGGADVRFSESVNNAKHLPYQIERWDAANKVAELWVLADSVKGSDSTQYMKMYWGNAAAVDSQKSASVFDAANGFAGVWHFNNNDFSDATVNHNNAVNYGTVDTAGVIGGSRKFVNTRLDSIRVVGLLGSPATATVSAWVKINAKGATSASIISMGDNVVLENKTDLQMAYHYSGGWRTGVSTTNLIGAGWKHVVFECNPAAGFQIAYVNGQSSITMSNADAIVYALGKNTLFGKHGNGGVGSEFGGIMDEIRIENTGRSADWIKLCYENQRTGSTMLTLLPINGGQTAPSNLIYKTNPLSCIVGTAIAPNTPTVTGTVTAWSITPALPAGLSFANGVITGTPLAASATTSYTVTASNSAGSTNTMLSITVTSPIVAPSNLTYAVNPLSCVVGTAIVPNTPKVSGTVTTWSITPPLPAGLSLNSANGIISGTPSAVSATASYTVTASNSAGSTNTLLSVTVTSALVAPSNLMYAINPLVCVVGTAITPNTPTVSGTVTTWSIAPPLPPGLSLNSANGIISGTPSTVSALSPYVVTARNAAGATTVTLSISIGANTVAPTITSQSGNILAAVNAVTAKAWIKATGTGPLSYQWSKNGTTLPNAANDTLFLNAVTRTDNLSIYRCAVSNTVGSVNGTPCTLWVVAAGFNANPITGNDTLTVAFIDSSLGNNPRYPLTRNWSFGDGAVSTAINPSHFYGKPNAYTARLVVSANGAVDSMKQTITLAALPLKAQFKADTTTAPSTLKVTFTDLSIGTVYSRLWSFGDGVILADSNTRAPVIHTYSKTGSDTVKLTVNGPAGSNTAKLPDYIFIYSPNKDNPIRIAGQYSSKTISVVFSNFSGLSDAFPPPYVSRIELWSKKNALPAPADTIGALPMKTYSLSSMKAAGAQFTDALLLTGTYSANDSLGLITDILWNNGTRSAFLGANGTYISLRDDAKPINNLAISGNYPGGSLADFYIDNVSSLDPAKAAFIELQYDFTDSVNFSSGLSKEIQVATAISGAKNNRYTVEISNPLCGGAQRPLYCAVSVKGVNSVLSLRKTNSFFVGTARPDNPLHLSANMLSSSSIQLIWASAGSVDSMRIWYSSQKSIPLGYDISETDFQKMYVAPGALSAVVSGLEPSTTCYFGAQVNKNGLWSYVTPLSSASAKTDVLSDVTKVTNTIRLDAALFDASTNRMKVAFVTDTTGHYADALDAGLSWSVDPSAGVAVGSPARVKAAIGPRDTVIVDLGDLVLFNTTYYVALWLRKQGAAWASPTEKSMGSFKTADFTWQNVKYGNGYSSAYADNKIFRILIDTTVPYPTDLDNNIIIRWLPPNPPGGFIQMSPGFEFGTKISSPPLHIGIQFGALPAGYTPDDIKMYRFDQGLWLLDRSPLSYTDGYVSVFTRNINSPFIAMIDTLPPSVSVLSRPGDPVAAGLDVADSFTVSDNVANVTWRFNAAKAGGSFDGSSGDSGMLNAYSSTVNSLIDAGLVSADEGVRAKLTVDDGTHTDVVDVSRRVRREKNSDVVVTDAMTWVPLRSTAQLDKQGARAALKAFGSDSAWKYDSTQFRLFRWCPYDGNAMNDSNKWVEYSSASDSLFSFVPGRVAWIKTRRSVTIDLGPGATPDLTRSDTMELQPHTWTDLALVHRFDCKLGDIFDASKAANQPADSLHVISFMQDGKTGKYYPPAEVYFYPIGLGDSHTTLSALQNGATNVVYSVYNQFQTVVKWIIPPVPTAMSKYAAVHKKKSVQQWVLKISGTTSGTIPLAPVYCGYSQGRPGKKFFPSAPSLESGAAIHICDEEKRGFGYVVQTGMLEKEGGVVYELAFNNNSDRMEEMHCAVDAINGMPKSMRMTMVDPVTGAFDDPASSVRVPVEARGIAYRQLFMGTEEYLAKEMPKTQILKPALLSVYPNPFKQSVRIRYCIPPAGLSLLQFRIFNPSGREVWDLAVDCRARAGIREIAWSGKSKTRAPAASGIYILRMTALNFKGAQVGVFEKKMTYLP